MRLAIVIIAMFNNRFSARSQAIEQRMGRQLRCMIDGQRLFTEDFLEDHKARLRGGLTAVTRPVPLRMICSKLQLQPALAHGEPM